MAKPHRICSIEGCDNRATGKGMCQTHYMRWWRHGDSAVGGTQQRKAPKGAPMEFLLAALSHHGGDCLVWPFATDTSGYGVLKIDGELRLAHREVCRMAQGPAPTSKHETAHDNSGKPCLSKACVNPSHLRWATHSENEQDKLRHAAAA